MGSALSVQDKEKYKLMSNMDDLQFLSNALGRSAVEPLIRHHKVNRFPKGSLIRDRSTVDSQIRAIK